MFCYEALCIEKNKNPGKNSPEKQKEKLLLEFLKEVVEESPENFKRACLQMISRKSRKNSFMNL